MLWNSRSYVGLFQSIFYVPVLIVAAYLFFFKHGRPQHAWFALTLFSAVRIAGGTILIVLQTNQQNISYTVGAILLQGAGVLPLILSAIGMLKIIKLTDFPNSVYIRKSMVVIALAFTTSASLSVTGGSFIGIGRFHDHSDVATGLKLAKAGYALMASVIGGIAAFDLYYWCQYRLLSPETSRKVLIATALSVPFLAVRVTCACLSIFENGSTRCDPLDGSVALLITMHSLMEYIVVVIYFVVGFIIPPVNISKTIMEPTPAALLRQGDIVAEERQPEQWRREDEAKASDRAEYIRSQMSH